MNYYKRHIGDYAKKAAKLSMLEHGAYTILIDACYDREQFPTETEAIEWCWARNDEEIQAVKFVLKRFFIFQSEDGRFVQNRIKEEISAYHAACLKSSKTSTGRPRGVDGAWINSHAATTEHPSNHKPLTTNHKPETINQIPPLTPRRGDVGELFFDKNNEKGIENHATNSEISNDKAHTIDDRHAIHTKVRVDEKKRLVEDSRAILNFLNLKTGRTYEPVKVNLEMIMARLREASFQDCKSIIAKKCREWLKDERMNQYLRPATLFNRTKFWQYHGELKRDAEVADAPRMSGM